MIEVLKQMVEALKAMQSYAEAERKGLRICDEAIEAGNQAIAELESQELEVFHINTVFAIALGQFLAVLPIEWRFSPEQKRQIIFKKDNQK